MVRDQPLCVAAAILTLLSGTLVLGQAPRGGAFPESELASGTSDSYSFRVEAGDEIAATVDLLPTSSSASVIAALLDENDAKVREQTFPVPQTNEQVLRYVTRTSKTYRLSITLATGERARYRLRTSIRTPRERLAGSIPIVPTVRWKSPRIVQLEKEVTGGDRTAVERFWAEVQKRGAPLIEQMDTDREFLATVLWRAVYDTHNVLVLLPYGVSTEVYMNNIAGTNVWYLTVRVVRGSRFPYFLAPNHRVGDPQWGGNPTSQPDPQSSDKCGPQLFDSRDPWRTGPFVDVANADGERNSDRAHVAYQTPQRPP